VVTSVFVVDDHELVRKGLIDLINHEDDLRVAGSASSVCESLERFEESQADVAVLDIRLADGSGVDLCRELLALSPQLRVLMLTSFESDEALLGSMLNGAHGYLLKDIRNLELLSAIRKVAAGESLLDSLAVSAVTSRLRKNNNPASEMYELTEQEQRVLEHIGKGMTNREISRSMFLAEKTVKNYVSSLLRKLGLERRTQVAALAVRLGVNRQ
jgi:two-component system, NarL family, response regulator DevR